MNKFNIFYKLGLGRRKTKWETLQACIYEAKFPRYNLKHKSGNVLVYGTYASYSIKVNIRK
jgi:hypothetical protein